MERNESLKLNNRGLSLVELIVAIAIGVIVSGSIAALITFSIRMYNNESVNTAMQYELQSNINMMMDEIMGASTMAVVQNPGTGQPRTKYALFGIPYTDIKLDDGTSAKGFKGVIFVSSNVAGGKFRIFMKNVNVEAAPGAADAKAIADNQMTTYFSDLAAAHTEYLLGENCTVFEITPDPNNNNFYRHPTDTTKNTYKNPIEVKVELQFEKNGWGSKEYKKHVSDITYLRNKVENTIYVGTTPFYLKKKDD